jgi:gluconolactonase
MITQLRAALIVLSTASIMTGSFTMADDLQVRGDAVIVPVVAKLETLWEKGGFTEGAAAGPDGNMYFSDFAQPFDSGPARIMKFNPKSGKVSVHCPNSRMGNGLMFNAEGRLFACCASPLGGARALVEILPDGKVKPIVEKFEGKRFNSPNDLCIDSNGRIYFSDPKYVGPEEMELTSFDVYRYDPDGTIRIATKEIDKPNGVILSPDGKTLYVAETDNGTAKADIVKTPPKPGRMTLNAFRVKKDGSLGKKKVLHNFGKETGIDGMTVDVKGHIYAAVRSASRFGIVVFSPEGKEKAYIETPKLPTNCCFGIGKESKTLYITAGSGFYRIKLDIDGHHSVPKK